MFCWPPQGPGRWLIYQSHEDTPIVERSENGKKDYITENTQC